MAGDRYLERILADVRRLEDERRLIDQKLESLLDQQAQLSGAALTPQQTTVPVDPDSELHIRHLAIQLQLDCLAEHRCLLGNEVQKLRQRALARGRPPSPPDGSPASSSSEIETRVEEHTVEVSSSELGGTSKDLSKFEILMLNDTPHTLESADGYVRLDDQVEELRRCELTRRMIAGDRPPSPPEGCPASLSNESETGVEEHMVEVSSSELGGTSKDLSKFETLTLNDTPHTLESADGYVRLDDQVEELRRHELTRRMIASDRPPSPPEGYPASSSNESETGVEEHVVEVKSSELGCASKDLSKFETLTLNETPHTWESADGQKLPGRFWPPDFVGDQIFEMRQADERARLFEAQYYWPLDYQTNKQYADKLAEKLTQPVQAQGQHTYASKKEKVAANAKRWMSEEAMVAFRGYIESKDDLKGLDYEFDELVHQCFNVEHYYKIFHHFNFTVKIKKPGSADWTSAMYFAEVKSLCMIKRYDCYPLDQDDDGECYACKNQGMSDLRHPSKGIYDCGKEDIQFPFYYEDSDSDEFHPRTEGSESEDDDDMS